ncbi:hypothetical protein ACJX0J_022559, partial [Zea mays]
GIYIYKNLFLLESTRKKKIFSNNFHVYTYQLFSDTRVCLCAHVYWIIGIYIYKNLFLILNQIRCQKSTRKKKNIFQCPFLLNFHVYTYQLFSDTRVCL